MNAKDLEVLAKTVWAESRNQGLEGQIAVAWSIRNRVDMDLHSDGKPDWWGEGYEGVCKAPWQYSCWNKGDPNYPYLTGMKPIRLAELQIAQKAATIAMTGQEKDPTKGATHYYAASMKKPPVWAAHGTKTVQIGGHIFFKDVK